MTKRWLSMAIWGAVAGCVFVPNPHHVADGDSGSETATESGDGDGDGDGDVGDGDGAPTGDGDGTPGDGDGDGDGAGDGDGDGDATDTDCVEGQLGCPCTALETCDADLACVLGDCVDASSCDPVNDAVQVSATPTWLMTGDPPPEPPMTPQTFLCIVDGQDLGNQAVLDVQCDDMALLQSLVVEVQPIVAPIEDLLGNPNLAASVTIVVAPEGLYLRIDANGRSLYYVNGSTLFMDGITMYPWAIAPFSSSCGQTPAMCGEVERLALWLDEGVVFDGNAAQVSPTATAWIEQLVDECGTLRAEVVLLSD